MEKKRIKTVLSNKYFSQVKPLILHELKGEKVRVILFGSRVRGGAGKTSDIDIGVIPHNGISPKKMSSLEEKIDNLNIPYMVDLVNLSEAGKTFYRASLKDAIIWKD